MLTLTSETTRFSTAIQHHAPENETFQKVFECWLVEQDQHLQDLISVVKNLQQRNGDALVCPAQIESTSKAEEQVLHPLITSVLEHYESYYQAKSEWEKHNVLAMLTPSWRSKLEDAFLWIGGWRPSMAFHLLHSKAGIQFEAGFTELIRGLTTGDLGDLSPSQIIEVDALQRKTINEEKKITEKMAKQQETVADTSMVELSHIASEMTRNEDAVRGSGELVEGRVASALESKEEGLEEIIHKADDLRLRTLKGVVQILTPLQAAHFLIAVAELHLRVHEWGKTKDANHHH